MSRKMLFWPMATVMVVILTAVVSGPLAQQAGATDLFPTKRALTAPVTQFYSSEFGTAVAIGDVNADGDNDIIVGELLADVAYDGTWKTDAGQVVVLLGPCFLRAVTLTGPTPEAGAEFGLSLAVGQINTGTDSIADIVVGSPKANAGGTDRGAVYVFYGSSDLSALATADNTLTAPSAQNNAQFGRSLAIGNVGTKSAGPDTYNEVIVGAPYWDDAYTDAGRAFIFWGAAANPLSTSTVIYSPDQDADNEWFGFAVAVGNFDGSTEISADPPSGYDEILVGKPRDSFSGLTYAGSVPVYQGKNYFPEYPAPYATLYAQASESSAQFGTSIAAGKINSDAYADVVVGAPYTGYRDGKAYVTAGRASPAGSINADDTLLPPANGSVTYLFGNVVAAGDIDGDGRGDVFAPAPGAKVGDTPGQGGLAGKIYVWNGIDDLSSFPDSPDQSYQDPNPRTWGYLGSALAIGDVGGDGDNDVVAGSPGNPSQSVAGRIISFQTEEDDDGDLVNDDCDNCSSSNPDQANSDSVPAIFIGWTGGNLSQGHSKQFIDYTIPTSGNASLDPSIRWFTDMLGDACDTDDDNDGLSDADEANGNACGGWTSNATKMDSDSDMETDGWECSQTKLRTDPAVTPSFPSATLEAAKYGTNPTMADTDQDGLNDDVEILDVTGNGAVEQEDAWSVCAALKGKVPYHVNLDIDKDGYVTQIDVDLVNTYLSAHSVAAINCQ